MAATLRQDQGLIQFTAAATLTSGQFLLLGETVGVVGADAVSGELAVLDAQPGRIHEVACNSADVITVGLSLFWDDGASELTLDQVGNFYAGKAASAAAGGIVLVELMIVNGDGVVGIA